MNTFITKTSIILFLFIVAGSCGDYGDYAEDITSPVIISNIEHHVGDNDGAEGLALSADFEMPSSFDYATISVTLPYPNSHGTSGFTSEYPPEIKINNSKIGIWESQLAEYSNCIDEYGDFNCSLTVSYDITSLLSAGTNSFQIRSVGNYGHADDFVFSDVIVSFE